MSDCKHEKTAERRRAKSNGVVVIAVQCLDCGSSLREVPKEGRILAKLEWFDPSIGETLQLQKQKELEERQRQWQVDYRNRTGNWWDAYNLYLTSGQWKQVRRVVLDRDRICQKCFSNPAREAHHLTYATFKKRGFSYAAECVGLCKRCHDEETTASKMAILGDGG